jgi:3-oxoacyl-[acyl-carrier protein] reductase
MVETEGVHAAGFAESDFRKSVESQTPLGRIGQPADIAPIVAFLASSDASWSRAKPITSPAASVDSSAFGEDQR